MQWVLGALSLGIKRLGREADHLPSNIEESNAWSYISNTPNALMAWCLVMHKNDSSITQSHNRKLRICPNTVNTLPQTEQI